MAELFDGQDQAERGFSPASSPAQEAPADTNKVDQQTSYELQQTAAGKIRELKEDHLRHKAQPEAEKQIEGAAQFGVNDKQQEQDVKAALTSADLTIADYGPQKGHADATMKEACCGFAGVVTGMEPVNDLTDFGWKAAPAVFSGKQENRQIGTGAA